jgi:hypothetical protein
MTTISRAVLPLALPPPPKPLVAVRGVFPPLLAPPNPTNPTQPQLAPPSPAPQPHEPLLPSPSPLAAPHTHEELPERRDDRRSYPSRPAIDPFLAPAPIAVEIPMAPPPAPAATPVLDVFSELVRKVAWSRDGRRGAVRLELGGSSFAGATLLVEADELGRIQVRIDAPGGLDATEWCERIRARLAARGLEAEVHG